MRASMFGSAAIAALLLGATAAMPQSPAPDARPDQKVQKSEDKAAPAPRGPEGAAPAGRKTDKGSQTTGQGPAEAPKGERAGGRGSAQTTGQAPSDAQKSGAEKPGDAQGQPAVRRGDKAQGREKQTTGQSGPSGQPSRADQAPAAQPPSGSGRERRQDRTTGQGSGQEPRGPAAERGGAPDGGRTMQRGQTGSRQDGATPSQGGPAGSRSGTAGAAQPDQSGRSGARSQPQDSGTASARGQSGSTAAAATLNEEQRTRVVERITSSSNVNRVENVDIRVSVGARVPERIRTAPLPREIVEIVPQYRNYRYVVVRDEIVIVEPRTKKVVTVIPARGSRASTTGQGAGPRLRLAPQQREEIKRVVLTQKPAAVKVRVAPTVGARLPDDVPLFPFPDSLYSEFPELRDYRYTVIEEEIVIVDPSERRIVEVIT
jgi:hypothetical protein